MTASLPIVLLVDPAMRDRLKMMALLSGVARVRTPEPSEDPVRLVRHQRFDMVLVALPRLGARRGLSLCRTLKTDGARTPPVGLLDPWRRLQAVPEALRESLGNGYLGGRYDRVVAEGFLADLLAGRAPIHTFEPAPRTIWGRLRGGF
ncbi:MAG: hypothetical protein CL927_14730 [Deltaproteobacteria bacterium]|nr:hypothetical protein [Deltaproteobacteria bacterium]HCH65973.1 hypothetical protein [Deltaproteobacteria bacterium]